VRHCGQVLVVAAAALLCLLPESLAAQVPGGKLREPLPLEIAASPRGINTQAPISFSADGLWLAHTVETEETVAPDTTTDFYTATGFPLTSGMARPEATITHTRTGESIRLGGPRSASWSPVWSSDGSRIAFYSDEGGEAGLWVWDRATRTAVRVTAEIVRTDFGFVAPRWSADGERLLFPALPRGISIAEANANDAPSFQSKASPAAPANPDQPSVVVRRAVLRGAAGGRDGEPEATPTDAHASLLDRRAVDLVVVELRTGKVSRVAERIKIDYYAWSPDGRYIAYTTGRGFAPNTMQGLFDFEIRDLAGGTNRRVASGARMGWGYEWHWSPDGRHIAYLSSSEEGRGEVVVISVEDGSVRALAGGDLPSFNHALGSPAPLWAPDGKYIYGVARGELWRLDVGSGQGQIVTGIDGWRIAALMTPFEQPTLWSTNHGSTLWAVAREVAGGRAGIFAVDIESGSAQQVLAEAKSYTTLPMAIAASAATGEVAFVSTDQQHLPDIWLLDTATGKVRHGTQLNEALDRYELGQVELIEWTGPEGQPLRGALMLPPGYRPGQRLPLVAWVYGGQMGSRFANQFGFWGDIPVFNMHVLATRGYAVLYPDAPVRVGRTMSDIVATIMPGIDTAIKEGYADPDRLALMGQSYGSYTALSLITHTTRFKAAVLSAAVIHPDLFADYLGGLGPGYYEAGQGAMGGTIWQHRDRYLENSPLFLFDRIETPILIGQGDRDGDLVPVNAIYTALERLAKPVEFRLYQGERHVLQRKANVIDFWERRLEFLAEHLGGAERPRR
jgi:dipeptidyl aminopeptidase/acylaminoacyl peptidase